MFGLSLLWSTTLSASDPKILEVDRNQPFFTINLKANPSTGYVWQPIHYDKQLLLLVDTSFVVTNRKLMGSPGISVFQFQRKASKYPKKTQITFKYARSFEPGSETLQKIIIHFN